MIDLYKEIDFTRKGEDNDVEYQIFLKEAAKQIAKEEEDQIKKIKRPQFDQQLQNHLIVAGIPVLKPQSKDKFLKVFQSFMDKKKIGKDNGLVSIDVGMENDVGNQTLYIIYKQATEAKSAFKKLDNLKFDKDHTLKCFTVKEIHEVMKFNPEYKQPKLAYSEELNSFNIEHDRMDQFIVREGNDIMIRWLDHIDKSTETAIANEYIKNDTAKITKVAFSPRGKYMVVCFDKGTYLYGGKSFELKGFYPQESPIDFKFSPNERYMITFNGNDVKSKENFVIWGVEEEIKLKSYRAHLGQTLESFQFNNKSTLFAVASVNEVFFYNLDSIEQFKEQLKLSDEESSNIKANHIQKIAWLQDNKSIVCLCYEIDYNPNTMAATKVFIYNVESKVERKWRTWTEHVKKGQIVVSQRGDWIAVVMRKFLKKNHYSTVIQIGNLLRTDDPIEISSIEIKEVIGNVSWDFKSNKIGIIHEDESTRRGINVKHVVEFYQIVTKGKKLDLVKIEEVKNILSNRVVIAAGGAFFAVYNISESSPERGKVSFGLFLREKKDKKSSAIEWIKENIMIHQLTFFKVDASGRFVLLGTDKSYQVWNIIGEIIFKDTLGKTVGNLEWRPRMFKSLSEEEEEKIIQQDKEIRKKYEDLDARKLDFLKYQKEQLKKQRQAEFLTYLQKKRQWSAQFIEKRKKILGFDEILSRTAIYEVITDIQIV